MAARRQPSRQRSHRQMRRLDDFMKREGLTPRQLAKVALFSRQHLLRLRNGVCDPTRHVMVRLAMACTLMLRRPVMLEELFDLTDAGM